eukprot:scaffold4282_cov112-Cylindrotheca_fusiformis.AAC.16
MAPVEGPPFWHFLILSVPFSLNHRYRPDTIILHGTCLFAMGIGIGRLLLATRLLKDKLRQVVYTGTMDALEDFFTRHPDTVIPRLREEDDSSNVVGQEEDSEYGPDDSLPTPTSETAENSVSDEGETNAFRYPTMDEGVIAEASTIHSDDDSSDDEDEMESSLVPVQPNDAMETCKEEMSDSVTIVGGQDDALIEQQGMLTLEERTA